MTIKKGDKVKIEYTGTLEDGKVFDSSKGKKPLEFEVGAGKVISGFDKAVTGMKKGEEKEVTIKPENAYGKPNDKLKKELPKSSFPEGKTPKVGMNIALNSPKGKIPARIVKVSDDKITIDLNHPLAGKTLNFKVKVVDVE